MFRRGITTAMLAALFVLAASGVANAATTYSLTLDQGAAFAILGHSCGGIQEKAYATGFGAGGFPGGDVYLTTRCGGSGRGGGYKTTTYTAWAAVSWNWLGERRSYGRLEGAAEGISETFSAQDAYGDREYNAGTAAYLETTNPPLKPPAPPTEVTATLSPIETVEEQPPTQRFVVGWTPAPETASMIRSSTVTAEPVASSAPVLTAAVSGGATSAIVSPLQRGVTYRITVTSTDSEGTSEPSAAIEAKVPLEEGPPDEETPPGIEAPEFGRCIKVAGEKQGTVTIYEGGFTTATCEEASATHSGRYEWTPGVLRAGFTTAIKPTTKVMLETTERARITCTGESGSGIITGPKNLSEQIILSGCETAGQWCTSPGAADGTIETGALEGTLALERVTFTTTGREVRHDALVLRGEGGAPFAVYSCAGGEAIALEGGVIAPVSSGHMTTATTMKLAQSAGRQRPEALEGGIPEVLLDSLGNQTGLALSSIQSGEEAAEINPVV